MALIPAGHNGQHYLLKQGSQNIILIVAFKKRTDLVEKFENLAVEARL